MKTFLFDAAGELIKAFPGPAELANAIGVGEGAISAAIKRGSCVSGRYYVAGGPKLPAPIKKGMVHNVIFGQPNGQVGYNSSDIERRITPEEHCGLIMLAQSDFNFDEYLFGSFNPIAERAESIPQWKSKFWKEGDNNFNY